MSDTKTTEAEPKITDVTFERPKEGETAKQFAARMAPEMIAAMNRDRAKRGLPPMPKS